MPDLLHPAVVHLPLGLALLIALLVQFLIVLGSYAAIRTGEGEEDRVERLVPHAALESHEEAAQVFAWAAAGLLALTLLPLLPLGSRFRRVLPFILFGLSIVVLALALRTGKAGGDLVYIHQAPAARAGYELPAGPSPGPVLDEGAQRKERGGDSD
jgi:uncharacterized membrane protein